MIPSQRALVQATAVAAVYFLLARLGLTMASINNSASPVWPATGWAIASLTAFGLSRSPAIALGAFAANHLAGTPVLVNIAIAAGNTLEAVAGAWLARFILSNSKTEGWARPIAATLSVSLLSPVVSAGIGNAALIVAGILPLSGAAASAATWWVGDALGALCLLPLAFFPKNSPGRRAAFAAAARGARPIFLVAAGLATMAVALWVPLHGLLFLLMLLLLVAGLAFEPLTTIWTSVVIASVSVAATVTGHGTFTHGSMNDNLINLQLFLAALASTALVLPSLLATRRRLLPIVTLLGGWAIAGMVYQGFRSHQDSKDAARFQVLIDKAEQELKSHMLAYQESLMAGAALFAASDYVSLSEWRSFVSTLRVGERYPGILGVGVVLPVTDDDLVTFEQETRIREVPDFRVHSVTSPEATVPKGREHFIIKYVEPLASNRDALGLDVATESRRFEAANHARQTGRPTFSGTIVLVPLEKHVAGFHLYVPMYRNGQEFRGWIYAAFTNEDFFTKVLVGAQHEFFVSIYDRPEDPTPVFSSFPTSSPPAGELKHTTLHLAERALTMTWGRSPQFLSAGDAIGAWVAFFAAIVVLLVASVIVTLQNAETRATQLAAERTQDLTDAWSSLKLAVAASRIGLFYVDVANNRTTYSDEFRSIMGASPTGTRDLDRDFFYKIIDTADLPTVKERVSQFYAGEIENFDLEYKIDSPLRGPIWVRTFMHAAKRDNAGKPVSTIAYVQDVSELRSANEHLKVATEAKSRFLATMSHEIRTPLNGVLGIVELLSETRLDGKQREYLQLIDQSGRTLMAIINDVLDLSKLESGKLSTESVAFSPSELVRAKISLLAPTAEAKGVTLSSSLHGAEGIRLGDPGRVGQVLLNLIGNAIKFTEKGAVTIKVSAPRVNTVRFEVEDTGIGLKADQLDRIFEPFAQGDDSTSRKYGGTGLGLSICKRIVEAMNGRLGVDSKFGIGSTFWFEVPLPTTDDSAETLTSQEPRVVVPLVRHGRILVAEDNTVNQFVIRAQLERLGFDHVIVPNGQQVLEILRREAFDLVLMDCQMPEMDGFEATRVIRDGAVSGARDIPIIALTANALEGDDKRCREAGMNDYLTKPVRVEALAAKLEAWLCQSKRKWA